MDLTPVVARLPTPPVAVHVPLGGDFSRAGLPLGTPGQRSSRLEAMACGISANLLCFLILMYIHGA